MVSASHCSGHKQRTLRDGIPAFGAYIASFRRKRDLHSRPCGRPADSVSGMIGRLELLRMLEAASSSMSGIAEVTHAVAAMKTDYLGLSYVPAAKLLAVYQRRRARLPDAHPTSTAVDWLLNALPSYVGADVGLVMLKGAGRVMFIWLTEQGDSVLATLVGDDHREVALFRTRVSPGPHSAPGTPPTLCSRKPIEAVEEF